jgi:hypothetical protein
VNEQQMFDTETSAVHFIIISGFLHFLFKGNFYKFGRTANGYQNRHPQNPIKDIVWGHGLSHTNMTA